MIGDVKPTYIVGVDHPLPLTQGWETFGFTCSVVHCTTHHLKIGVAPGLLTVNRQILFNLIRSIEHLKGCVRMKEVV